MYNNIIIPIKKLVAFTLSEILITMVIIGIAAAMTIPIIINNIEDAQFKTAYKKAYSTISQAFLNAQQNGDIVPLTGTYSAQGAEANFAAMQGGFKLSKDCAGLALSNCWSSGESFDSQATYVTILLSFIDTSGMAWRLRAPDSMNMTPVILVDTNANKGPNQYGKDRFPFLFATATKTAWGFSDLGIPVRIIPAADFVDSSRSTYCPSYDKHPCYNTSWLIDKN